MRPASAAIGSPTHPRVTRPEGAASVVPRCRLWSLHSWSEPADGGTLRGFAAKVEEEHVPFLIMNANAPSSRFLSPFTKNGIPV